VQLVLIAAYRPDRQESMLRFADALAAALRAAGDTVEVWHPPAVLGRLRVGGLTRWLGFVDKLILGPPLLIARRLLHPAAVFHITDHCLAFYLRVLPRRRTLVTCHDVIGFLGALGRLPGVRHRAGSALLQRWLMHELRQAPLIACVSEATRAQVAEVVGATQTVVIDNGLNDAFAPPDPAAAEQRLAAAGIAPPFVFHLGSNQWQKNRAGVVAIFASLRRRGLPWRLALAGAPWDHELRAAIAASGCAEHIIELGALDHATLVACYACAEATVFPSLAEGFGWPVAEAQACGGVVVASNRAPLPDVGGDGAGYADPTDPEAFADAVLGAVAARDRLVPLALVNAQRFAPATWAERHREQYRRLTP
jgi:glycosyltransferase involved in cell wall biosynthesis